MDATNDFNILLAMAISENNEKDIDDETCLISGEPLQENYIKFDCSHKFNYEAIYNEVIIQKKIFNCNEVQRLSKYSMKCPYCRHIQKGLLPPRIGFKKVLHVNFPTKYAICLKLNICPYVFKSGKKKGLSCDKACELKYCNRHFKIIQKREMNNIFKEVDILKDQKNKKITNEKITNEKITNEKITNEKITNEKITNEKITNEKITNEKITNYTWKTNIVQEKPDITLHDFYFKKSNENTNISNNYLSVIQSKNINKATHPKFNIKNKHDINKPIFQKQCEHVFTRGKNKGQQCTNMVDCTSRNMQELRVYPKYFKHYFCSQHCKSKKNKKKMIEISKPQNIYIEKFFNVYPEESMNFSNDNISIAHTNFIKKYYSKYYDLIEYSLNIHIGDSITQTYANFILKKSKKKKIHDYPVLVV